jgi:hypothetical protein
VSALTCLRSEGSAVAIESVQSTAELESYRALRARCSNSARKRRQAWQSALESDAEIAEPPATETTY